MADARMVDAVTILIGASPDLRGTDCQGCAVWRSLAASFVLAGL